MDVVIDKDLLTIIMDKPLISFLMVLVLFLFFVVGLLIQDADRGERFKASILKPLFEKFSFASRQYIAAKVGSTVSTIIKEKVTGLLTSINNLNLKIKWVKSAKDPILKEDGTLILYLQESEDQTNNILSATRAALPRIICPHIRTNISNDLEKAIDLTILKKITEDIGDYAYPVFRLGFLNKELEEDNRVGVLFESLVEIDNHGIFVSIFLEELSLLGKKYSSEGQVDDRTASVENFLTFLLQFPRRKDNPIISFLHITQDIKVALVLVALTVRVENEGATPYLNRIRRHLKAGAESIYLYAYTYTAIKFVYQLIKILEGDENIWVKKINRIDSVSYRKSVVVILRRNRAIANIDFDEKVAAREIETNSLVIGQVKDASRASCFVDVNGIGGVITSNQCSWYFTNNCKEFLAVGEMHEFSVLEIDQDRGILHLSLRKPGDSFWILDDLPEVGNVIDVKIVNVNKDRYVCLHKDKIQLELPFTELSWYTNELPNDENYINKLFKVYVYEKDVCAELLLCSICRVEENPWPKIKDEITGKTFKGIVVNVTNNKVDINLDNGLPAYITDSEFTKTGSELIKFQEILVPGSKLDVKVDHVFENKKKIRAILVSNAK